MLNQISFWFNGSDTCILYHVTHQDIFIDFLFGILDVKCYLLLY